VVIALVVTPDGFPLAYAVMPGNTSDKTTLSDCPKLIEAPYGKANRTWVGPQASPPRRRSRPCARPTRRSATGWALPRAG